MKIKSMKIELIKPYWRNPRDNSETLPELKKSISEFGFNVPLVLDSKNVIITGHARYRAAIELDMREVPVYVVDLDEKKAKEYRIADNKIHDLTTWLYDDLVSELGSAEFLHSVPGFGPEDAEGLFPTQQDSDFRDFTDAQGAAGGDSTGEDGQTDVEEEPDVTGEPSTVMLLCPHCFEEREYDIATLLQG